MPNLMTWGAWKPEPPPIYDYAYYWDCIPACEQGALDYIYGQMLLAAVWVPKTALQGHFIACASGWWETRLDAFTANNDFQPLTLTILEVDVDGYTIATPSLSYYFAYRLGGGDNNPGGYWVPRSWS